MFYKILFCACLIANAQVSINAETIKNSLIYNDTIASSNYSTTTCPFGYYANENGHCSSLGFCGVLLGPCKCSSGYNWLCRCSCLNEEILISNSTGATGKTTVKKPDSTRFPFTFPLSAAPKCVCPTFLTAITALIMFLAFH